MTIASFGNLFGPDTLIIFLVILVLFGAKKLPELAKGLGQAVREFSKAKDDLEREVTRPPEPARQLDEPRPVASHEAHQEPANHPETHPEPVHQEDPHQPKPSAQVS